METEATAIGIFGSLGFCGYDPIALVSESELQRRARRHATINVVDVSDVRTCQDMVDVSDVTTCQNIRKVSEHMYPDKNVM